MSHALCRIYGTPPPFKLAVGPWHVLGHIAKCQKKYGARVALGMGLSFGDNPEHLWAELRKFCGLLKYTSPAGRKDFLHDLVIFLGFRAKGVCLLIRTRKMAKCITANVPTSPL
jgi:hypothetical protein